MLNGQISLAISGTAFVVVGLMSLAVALIRRRSPGVLAVLGVGVWSVIYGTQRLNDCDAFVAALPHWMQVCIPYSHAVVTYSTLVAGTLTFRELTLARVRQVLGIVSGLAALIAVGGVAIFVRTGDENVLLRYNHLLTNVALVVLLATTLFRKLAHRYGSFVSGAKSKVLLTGAVLFGLEALGSNIGRSFTPDLDTHGWDDLGFAAFLLSLGYVAMQRVYSGELRLSSIENELAIARQLQFAILPTSTPELRNLRIAAVYEPMSAVAGDFYEFLPVDNHRSGFLVADVSGHGVPAALIASMIKLAAKSVAAHASDPAELLRRLREVLSGQLQGQFVSVAYLWIDAESRKARYSAAGHPPLLLWRAASRSLERIASNGLLLGVPADGDFPACEIEFSPGDRFLLYTDGVSEPENAVGEAFGDRQLEQFLRDGCSVPAAELSLQLLARLRTWTPPSTPQQDDITILVIDVL